MTAKQLKTLSKINKIKQPKRAKNTLTFYLDEQLWHKGVFSKYLTEQGHTVRRVPLTWKDKDIQIMLDLLNKTKVKHVLITKNYKDFKTMTGVIRFPKKLNTAESTRLLLNTAEAIRINPDIWLKLKQIPASGLNKGTIKP